eukprot:3940925-Rhodomonas_salina.2
MLWLEDSVWVREAGGQYPHRIIVRAHIDDRLMACESTDTMAAFKKAFLMRFEARGTDDGEVTTYLGCELICDRVVRTIVFRQAVYAKKILQLYCAWDKNQVKTPLQPGTRLSKEDSPEIEDQVLHCSYHSITRYLSFLVTMTQCNLVFSYAELSKFVQLLGEVHLAAAEHLPRSCAAKQVGGLGGFRLRIGSRHAQVCHRLRAQPEQRTRASLLESETAGLRYAQLGRGREVHTSHLRASILRSRHGSQRIDDAGEVCRNAQRGRRAHEEPPGQIIPASHPVPYGHMPGVQDVLHGHWLQDALGSGRCGSLRDSLKSYSLSGGEAPADTLDT